MHPSVRGSHSAPRLNRLFLFITLGWLALVGISLVWNIASERKQLLAHALIEARASYDKDLLYRRWVAERGGVYVPPSAQTPPNPYLKDLPERDVVTTDGKALTLVNPAYMTRQVFEMSGTMGGVHGHITSLNPIRPENSPDPWERTALQAFERGVKELSAVSTIGGKEFLRLMRPMIAEQSCLKCHENQGYKLGDIRGGISVSVPLSPLSANLRSHLGVTTWIHLLLGGLGLVGLFLGHRWISTSLRAQLTSEEARRSAESRWRVALEATGDGLWVWNVETAETFYSSSWKAMLGYGPDELDAHVDVWKSLIHPEDATATLAVLQRCLDGETAAYESEHRLRCKDGSYKWILDRGRVVTRTPAGRPLVMFGTQTDIAVRRAEEARRRKAAEQARQLLDLYTQAATLSEQQLYDHVVEIAVSLTESEIGFLHCVTEDQEHIALTTWNHEAKQHCTAAFEQHYPISQAGNWVECVRQQRPVVYNDFAHSPHQKGLPSGHSTVRRFMSLPVLEGGKVRIIFGVGNKASDYGDEDVTRLQLVAGELQKILARTRAEKQLRLAHDRAESYLEVAGVILLGLSVDGTVNLINHLGAQSLGYARQELLGRNWFESCLPAEERARSRTVWQRLIAGESSELEQVESAVVNRVGQERMIAWRHALVRGSDGQVIGTLSSGEDITDRRRADAALRASEERYRLLVENVVFPVTVTSVSTGRVLFVNQRAIEFFSMGGAKQEDVNAVDFWADPTERGSYLKELLALGRIDRREMVMRSQLGRLHWVEISATLVDFEGERAAFSVLNDISRRKATEASLRHSESQLVMAMRLARAGSWEFDLGTGRFTFNDGFYALFATTAEREGGYQMKAADYAREFLFPEEVEMVEAQVAALRAAVPPAAEWALEHRIRRRDGAIRHLAVRISAVWDDTGRVLGSRGVNQDVTERVKADSEMRKLSRAVEQSPVAVVITDKSGAIEYANSQFIKSSGYTLDELMGRNPRLLKSGVQPESVYRELWSTINAGREWHGELWNRRKDSSLYYEDVSISPVFDEKRCITHFLGVKEDITLRREAQAALARSEQRFRSLVQSVPNIAVQGYDRERRVVLWNSASTAIYGYTAEEAMGRRWEDLILPPDLQADVIAAVDRWILRDEAMPAVEAVLRRKDGSPVVVFSSRVLLRDTAGGVELYCIDIDLRQHKAAEARVSEQAALIEFTRDAIIVIDLTGRVKFWNHGAEVIYGWTTAEAKGSIFSALVNDETHPMPSLPLATVLDRGEWSGELRQCTKSGATIRVRAQGVVMCDPHGAPHAILLTASDITEEKRLEDLFLRAQRLESVGELASGVAHDLNNVLSPIMMSVELLRPLAVTSDDREVLRLLGDSARRGADVVRQLLLFGRGGDVPSDSMDVGHVLSEILRMMRETFPRSLTISGQVPRDLWPIRGYSTQIYQVLLNFAVNARDAMPAGGQLTISARNLHLDEDFARHNPGVKPGRHIELAVIDSGVGIPDEILARIFDPFFSTKEQGKGSGLGLSTAIGIVKSLGGIITVSSRLGVGSEFRVYFPAAGEGAGRDVIDEPVALAGRGETLLVVDDEASIRNILGRSLTDHGYQVLVAAAGEEALSLADKHRGVLRGAILDMMMPGMDGPELVRRMRGLLPDLPIIACSGLEHYRADLAALGLSRVRFLRKPFLPSDLRAVLRAELDSAPASDPPSPD